MSALSRATLLITLLAVAVVTATGSAQEVTSPLIQLGGGQMHYELQRPRNGGLIAFRLASPFVPLGEQNWLVEGSADYRWYRNDADELHHFAVTEVQLQLHSGGRLQPYIGVGGGIAFQRADTTLAIPLTGSGSVGVRVAATEVWGLAAELRYRALDVFRKMSREITVSVFRRLQ